MKLSNKEAGKYFARPDPNAAGCLIYGADAMRVALRRQEAIAGLIGPDGEKEMRLARLPAADLRKTPSLACDEMKARGFFPGPRVVFVEDASDSLAKPLAGAIEEWREGDAQLIVTAGRLAARSSLRKLFEGDRRLYSIGIYDEPPSRDEIQAMIGRVGLGEVEQDAMSSLIELSRAIGPGDFRQTLDKLALYKHDDATPTSVDDVEAVAPVSVESGLDDILNVVAESKTEEIGPLMQRLTGQGVLAVSLCIAAARHFRALYAAASDPGGAKSGVERLSPPVFGPRRDRMIGQVQAWGVLKLEHALRVLADTDLLLRSADQRAPQMALMERCLIRLAMLGARRR